MFRVRINQSKYQGRILAQYVGTATESLIRTLSDFKSEKLIEIKEGKISVTNPEKLKNLLY